MLRVQAEPSSLYFITAVTNDRRPIFRDRKLAERLGTMILMACRLKGYTLLVYSILPDHVHLLVTAVTEELALEKASSNDLRRASSNDFDLPTADPTDSGRVTSTQQGETRLSRPPSATVSRLMQSIKGTFSRTLQSGHVWQRGSFIWLIDHPDDALRVIEYIRYNYRKTNLPNRFGRSPYVFLDEAAIGENI